MKVKDIMTKRVITVSPANTLFDVVTLLSEKKISGVPVIEKNKLAGIISETDILDVIGKRNLLAIDKKSLEKLKRKGLMKIKQIMKHNVITVEPDDDVKKAASLMDKYEINRLPVVKDKKVIGIVGRADIVRNFSEYLSSMEPKRKRGLILETNVDRLFKLIETQGKIKISKAAKVFEVPKSKIEEWGKILEDYNLIRLHYPTIGEPILKLKEGKIKAKPVPEVEIKKHEKRKIPKKYVLSVSLLVIILASISFTGGYSLAQFFWLFTSWFIGQFYYLFIIIIIVLITIILMVLKRMKIY